MEEFDELFVEYFDISLFLVGFKAMENISKDLVKSIDFFVSLFPFLPKKFL